MSRTYPVPTAHRSAILGATATLERIDLAATMGDDWARRIIAKENAITLGSLLGEDLRMPVGELDDDGLIVRLRRGGLVWQSPSTGWVASAAAGQTELLEPDTVAFVARSLEDGSPVLTVPYTPFALLSAGEGDPAGPSSSSDAGVTDLPAGAKVLAVVDQFDHEAVMDVVAVLPGPVIMRRHDGQWHKDPQWVKILRSVRPPPVVPLNDTQIPSVLSQVDDATKDVPWVDPEQEAKQSMAASAWTCRADEMRLEWALLAAPIGKAMSKATPGGRMPPKLQRYWTSGEGGAKIRWGTPGAWTRCHALLSRYFSPAQAKGACTNLGEKMGGYGKAYHVGG